MVPPLLNQSASAAGERLRRLGLEPELQIADRFSPAGPGTVADQDPPAGQSVLVGSNVRLLIASGNVAIPAVLGLPEEAARQQLHAAGFEVDTRRARSASVPVGYAADVRPGPGASLPAGATVILIISQGP